MGLGLSVNYLYFKFSFKSGFLKFSKYFFQLNADFFKLFFVMGVTKN